VAHLRVWVARVRNGIQRGDGRRVVDPQGWGRGIKQIRAQVANFDSNATNPEDMSSLFPTRRPHQLRNSGGASTWQKTTSSRTPTTTPTQTTTSTPRVWLTLTSWRDGGRGEFYTIKTGRIDQPSGEHLLQPNRVRVLWGQVYGKRILNLNSLRACFVQNPTRNYRKSGRALTSRS